MQEQQITTLGKRTPDYTCDKSAAKELAKRVEEYYHKKGYKSVKVWLELNKERGYPIWEIRTNLLFSLDKI